MTKFDSVLESQLEAVRDDGLYRFLRPVVGPPGPRIQLDGRDLINFASNDYLALARHPGVVEAAVRAARDLGGGSTSSRLLAGSLALHHRLEEALAAWKGVAAATVFSSGYAAALGVIPALVGPDDFIVVDRLVHACCVDGARLSRATLRVFPHNDAAQLDSILARLRARHAQARILVITESVFSMDGDLAPLREIVEAKDRHEAWLLLDEAHAAGLYGARRSGLAESLGLEGRIEVHLGTLSKTLGAAGGYVAGSAKLAEWLVNSARSFIFSTAPAPAASAAAHAALALLQGADGAIRAQRLWENIQRAHSILPQAGRPAVPESAILPWRIGAESAAVAIAASLAELGICAPPIRYPTVARGAARLRFAITAAHDMADLYQLAIAVAKVRPHRAGPRVAPAVVSSEPVAAAE